MREIRTSGSEGGGVTGSPYPYCRVVRFTDAQRPPHNLGPNRESGGRVWPGVKRILRNPGNTAKKKQAREAGGRVRPLRS